MCYKYLFFGFFLCLQISFLAQEAPGKDWEYHHDPNNNGWLEEDRRALYQYLVDSTKVTSALIIHQGKIVFQYGDIKQQNYLASCRKSVLSMLYGKYVDNEQIDLSTTLAQLEIDDVGGVLPIESKATIQDLISSRSGIYRPASNGGTWVKYIKPRGTVTPGTRWLYNNWDFNVAGYLFESLTEKNIYDEITNQLANPLQMQDWDRSIQQKLGDASRSKYLAYHMWFSTRDFARLGQLMLNEGNWNGKQLISKNWIQEMLKTRTTSSEMIETAPVMKNTPFGYGYMWWLWDNDENFRLKNAYAAFGAYGQSLAVFPEIDAVVVFNTKVDYGRSNNARLTQKLPVKMINVFKQN